MMTDNKNIQSENFEEKQNSSQIPEPSPKFKEDSSGSNTEKQESSPSDEWHTQETGSDQAPQGANQPPYERQPLAPMPPNEERTWAMLAHLSVLLNLITGFLGGVAAIIIYFIYKDRSRLVAYHAMQSFIFQTITWLGAGLIAGLFIAVGSALAFLIIPLLCLVPGFLILLLIPVSLIYGVIGGVKVNNGEDFRYWQVGDWVRDILEPKPISEA